LVALAGSPARHQARALLGLASLRHWALAPGSLVLLALASLAVALIWQGSGLAVLARLAS
jgi:hypothetical protein